MKLANTFKLIAKQMIEELEFIKLGPNELKGRSREILVSRFLKQFIPIDMDVCSGVVVSVDRQSGEIDVVIYDKRGFSLLKPFFDYYPEHLKPVPVEVVYAVMEVENYLNQERAVKCAKRIKRVKELPKVAYYEQRGAIRHVVTLYGKEWDYFPTLGIIFAFDGNLSEVRDALAQLNHPLEYGVDLVCILKRGLLTFYDPERKALIFPPEPGSQLVIREGEPEENLRILYLMLTRIFSQAWTRPVRVMDYFKPNNDE